MAFNTKIETVQVIKHDLDVLRYFDIHTGNGIRINSVEAFDRKNEKIYNGLQSNFFGSDFSDDLAFSERYSCKCKKHIGKAYEGRLCDACESYVEYVDVDLGKRGWIILEHFKVLSPIYQAKLSDALGSFGGQKILDRILEVDYDHYITPEVENFLDQIISDSSIDKRTIKKEKDKNPNLNKFDFLDINEVRKNPFVHRGMIWLSKNILTVLEYFRDKKPTKRAAFDELIEDRHQMFTNSIPVYSALLRSELPGEKDSKLYKLTINKIYGTITKVANTINDFTRLDTLSSLSNNDIININRFLAEINIEIGLLFKDIYLSLTKKKGQIAAKILGGRYNFSARNIIIQQPYNLRSDEIEVGYLCMLELFRYELTNLYSKWFHCTLMEADFAWNRATMRPDDRFHELMDYMCRHRELYDLNLMLLVSRNPCRYAATNSNISV